jgi:hypothetical protein
MNIRFNRESAEALREFAGLDEDRTIRLTVLARG